MGAVEPVRISVTLDDWARSVRTWSDLLGAEPRLLDVSEGEPARARFTSPGVASLDLLSAGGQHYRGDCEITFYTNDFDSRVEAVRSLGINVTVDTGTGDARVAAANATGIDVVFTRTRPEREGGPLSGLPYVFDIAVKDLDTAVPVWSAILGDEGVHTPIETDSARQFRMHHFLIDGETHAIGLMQLDTDQFIKRDSLGSSQEYILQTRGEGLLCIGFLYKTDLDEHISRIPDAARNRLQFESPRSYLMGRNNMVHADECGGVSVILAQHFEGWSGDLHVVDDLAETVRTEH